MSIMNRPWAEVLEHSERAYRILVERTGAMGNEDLAGTETLPWQEGRPLWRLIVGNSYSHPISHLGQYYAARGEVSQATAMQEEAAVLLAQLDESPSWIGVVRYNLACHYALIGQKEKAIEELRRALDLNPGLTEWSKEDPDFASIRGEPGYQQLYRE
jgi:tetratricopeptide (TPR) repeat protein